MGVIRREFPTAAEAAYCALQSRKRDAHTRDRHTLAMQKVVGSSPISRLDVNLLQIAAARFAGEEWGGNAGTMPPGRLTGQAPLHETPRPPVPRP